MNCRAYLFLAMCVAATVAENVNCWGSGANCQCGIAGSTCQQRVTRYDRLRVHTLLIAPDSGADTGKVLFSGVHFPNVDGQPPGRLVQLQFRGSFSQITGCACPGGNCETLFQSCACAYNEGKRDGTCTVEQADACVKTWIADPKTTVCKGDTAPPSPGLQAMASQTFLQISFGDNNFLSNTSTSADGAVGMPGYAYLNPTKGSSAAPADITKLQNYAFANAKALTALVQISAGEFVSAEWNWDKADSRCTSPSDRGIRFYLTRLVNPCGRDTDNPCINNLVCAVTFDYCLLNMMRTNTAANPGVVAPECDLVISLAWQGTDANRRFAASQNQMFSKFNALGLDNLIQQALTRGTDITSDIENRLKGP